MLRVVIVDDEPKARETISQMIANYCEDVEVVDQADCVKDGIRAILQTQPDLVLLDIKMPDGSGFDLLRQISNINFNVIFITAYEEYALKAFKFNAIDYILKPIDPDDLTSCIEKSKKIISSEKIQKKLNSLLASMDSPQKEGKIILIKTNDSIYPINSDDIIRCESERNYTTFYLTNGETILVAKSMKEFEDELNNTTFFRIHQSHFVNIKFIKRYIKEEAKCIMKDNSEVPVSWRKRDELMEFFHKF